MPETKFRSSREVMTTILAVTSTLAALWWVAAITYTGITDYYNIDRAWANVLLALAVTASLLGGEVWAHRHRLNTAADHAAGIVASSESQLGSLHAEVQALRALHAETVRAVAGSVRVTDLDELNEQLARRDGIVFTVLREVAGRLPAGEPIGEGAASLPDGMAAQIWELAQRSARRNG
jgi:hypothetical protein